MLGSALFLSSLRETLFHYKTVYFMGFFFFMLIQALPMLYISLRILAGGSVGGDLGVYMAGLGMNFMAYTFPLILVFSVAVSISNLSLIRHEGRRIMNLLGVIMGFALLLGYLIIFLIDINFQGEDEAFRIYLTVSGIYTTAFSYLECMLIATVVCGFIAAVKRPPDGMDYVIILGCRISKDGKPLPLLRSRCDGAIRYYRRQAEKQNPLPKLVASGGKGEDESVSEAEAIRGYLLEQGIPEEDILVENKSTNTRENMRFSMRLIGAKEGEDDKVRVAYSTTNYHVLRSGILANREGFRMKGIGCRTKWYFWPNAFLREFIGLMVMSYRQQIVVLLAFVGVILFFSKIYV